MWKNLFLFIILFLFFIFSFRSEKFDQNNATSKLFMSFYIHGLHALPTCFYRMDTKTKYVNDESILCKRDPKIRETGYLEIRYSLTMYFCTVKLFITEF